MTKAIHKRPQPGRSKTASAARDVLTERAYDRKLEAIVRRVEGMSSREVLASLKRAGIYTADGRLTAHYRPGAEVPSRKTQPKRAAAKRAG
jgi:hypothetical protein